MYRYFYGRRKQGSISRTVLAVLGGLGRPEEEEEEQRRDQKTRRLERESAHGNDISTERRESAISGCIGVRNQGHGAESIIIIIPWDYIGIRLSGFLQLNGTGLKDGQKFIRARVLCISKVRLCLVCCDCLGSLTTPLHFVRVCVLIRINWLLGLFYVWFQRAYTLNPRRGKAYVSPSRPQPSHN